MIQIIKQILILLNATLSKYIMLIYLMIISFLRGIKAVLYEKRIAH